MPVHLEERYTLPFACLAEVKSAGTLITTKWNVHHLSSPEFLRPREGTASAAFRCPTCGLDFTVRVESVGKARAERLTCLVVGAVLLALLLLSVSMVVHHGGQTVDEDQADSTVATMGVLVGLAAVSFIGGPTTLQGRPCPHRAQQAAAVAGDGRPSVRVKGHKFWP
ncbi:hypothetical protein BX265_0410 [Streptomyces sp. TLI_235]|nr:hypothetical protein [Streptomyces sp. TLI_235]PBC75735.1 hypothetical protein BX265_0410 [Streptomyces sp. TLI_235]